MDILSIFQIIICYLLLFMSVQILSMIIKLFCNECICIYLLLQNKTSDFIETFHILSYIFTYCGSKVGGQTIEGKRGVADYNLL